MRRANANHRTGRKRISMDKKYNVLNFSVNNKLYSSQLLKTFYKQNSVSDLRKLSLVENSSKRQLKCNIRNVQEFKPLNPELRHKGRLPGGGNN